MNTTTIGQALRLVSPTFRKRIKRRFFAAHGPGPLNGERRVQLEHVIFEEQSDLEHREPRHIQVEVMNGVRQVLLGDAPISAGGNETRERVGLPGLERLGGANPRDGLGEALAELMATGPRDASAAAPLAARLGRGRVMFLTGAADSFARAVESIAIPAADAEVD